VIPQVYSGSKEDAGDGEWVPVRPVPGSLTINTGDMMQVR
jgi:isopenicillin N synthase-like dioxygenase